MSRKLWGGRFSKKTDPLVERFTSSIAIDHRLAKHDVMGSIAHAKMLGKCRIIPQTQAHRLVQGLARIARRIAQGRFSAAANAEDIHTQIQMELRRLIGPIADTLQTARSRNDQAALDLRLFCRDAVGQLREATKALQRALVRAAAAHEDVVIPGYTHLQRAQPVLFAHHLLAYVEMLERDQERFADCLKRIDVLPLGSGALAGTSLPIDRRYVAKLLRFARIAENSLDAVSDRDFAIELLADVALLTMHLSRLAEDFILWSTEEFGIITLDEAFATGSSLMPQKKNPDVLELIRGQAGLASGGLVSLLSVLKGLPLAYNRDLQWDKTVLFQSVDRAHESLLVLARFIRHLQVQRQRVAQLLDSDALCATDVAEHLVQKGVPFRQAHELVGKLVRYAERSGRRLRELTLTELQRVSVHLDGAVRGLLDPRRSVARKQSHGGTGPRQVNQAIARWRRQLRTRG